MTGVAAAPGVARGTWVHVRRQDLPIGGRVVAGDDADMARFRDCANQAADDLMAMSDRVGAEAGSRGRGGDLHGPRDPGLGPDAHRCRRGEDHRVRRRRVAAIQVAGAELPTSLPRSTTRVLAARAADVVDVAERIARLVAGLPDGGGRCCRPRGRRGGGPLALADRDAARGAHPGHRRSRQGRPRRTRRSSPGPTGSRRSSGARGILAALAAAGADAELALDGATGEVLIAPDAAAVADLDARAARLAEARSGDLEEVSAPIRDDGRRGDHAAREHRHPRARRRRPARSGHAASACSGPSSCSSSGPRRPSEDEQAASYREAVEAFGGDPVTIRLLDIGGDKPIPYLPMPPEDNPFLGVRALRLAAGPARDLRDPAARLLPRRGRRSRQGDGADGRRRGRRGAAARPGGAGARGAARRWRRRSPRWTWA